MAYQFNETGSLFSEGATGKEAEAKKKAAEEMMNQRKTEEGETRAAASTGIGSVLGGIIGALVAGIPSGGAGAPAGYALGSAIGGGVGGLAGEAMKEKPSAAGAMASASQLAGGVAKAAGSMGGDKTPEGLTRIGNSGAYKNKEGVVVF